MAEQKSVVQNRILQEQREIVERLERDEYIQLFAQCEHKKDGCLMYRVVLPTLTMEELRLGCAFLDERLMPSSRAHDRDQSAIFAGYRDYRQAREMAMARTNVYLMYHLGGEGHETFMRMVRKENPDRPPVFIYDTDDHTDYIHPFNPQFGILGTRDPNTWKVLEPGAVIEMAGKEIWRDKSYCNSRYFDVASNLKAVEGMKKVARACDAVTVSSPYLAQYYRHEIGCKNVYVRYNAMRLQDFPRFKVTHDLHGDPVNPRQVRILWQGGPAHYLDWHELREPLGRVMAKYPQAKFICWGATFKSLAQYIPDNQIQFVRHVDFEAYHAMLGVMGAHINLCPLKDEPFNWGKSAIKWYEASCLPDPPATLAANIGPYQEIQDGRNGLLYDTPDEFEAKLGQLIENETMRRELGQNAAAWVRTYRDANLITRDWVTWMNEIRAAARKRDATVTVP